MKRMVLAVCFLVSGVVLAAEPDTLLKMLGDDIDWGRIGVEPGDAEGLLEYYRGREGVNYYFNRGDVDGIVAAIRREMPGEIEAAVALADEILAHRFQNSTSPVVVSRVQLPDAIDWDANPTEDPEFPHMLARSRFWQELALAYTYTGDEKYAAEFARQMASWLEQAPVPFSAEEKPLNLWWRTINTGIRMDTWMWVYPLFLRSEHMTAELHARMLGIIGEHGRVLRAHHQKPTSNWCAMEMQGLLNLSVMLPEFRESAAWREYAAAKLVEAIKTQVRPDGAQVEQSPSYHNGCIRWFFEPMHLARRNGATFPEEYLDILRKMAVYTLWTTGPDGLTVALSDSDRATGCREVLATMALEFNEPTFAYSALPSARHYWLFGAEAGEKLKAIPAKPPDALDMTFPDAGYIVARSDWTPQAGYCIFDCGPRGGGHGHFDLLSMEIHAYGKLLIADPGRWLYANVPLRREVMSTPAHSTISINGISHEGLESAGETKLFQMWGYRHGQMMNHDGFGGRHEAYKLDSGRVKIERQVETFGRMYTVIDRVEAPEPVTAQVNWQFATMEVESLGPNRLVAGPAGEPRVYVAAVERPGQEVKVEDSPISRVYASREDAKRLRVTQHGQSLLFITVIKPVEAGAPLDDLPEISFEKNEDGREFVSVQVGKISKHGISIPLDRKAR